ncbi:MAG: hypothetical protein AAGF24_05925 [Cyanobacteria bacterium P01_H01_bin.121]
MLLDNLALILVCAGAVVINLVTMLANAVLPLKPEEPTTQLHQQVALGLSLTSFLVWLVLAYANSQLFGLYSLNIFYGVIALQSAIVLNCQQGSRFNNALNAIPFLNVWILLEPLARNPETWSAQPLQAIALAILAFLVFLLAFALLFVIGSLVIVTFVAAKLNQTRTQLGSQLSISKILIGLLVPGVLLFAAAPVAGSLIQAKLLGISFAVVLWLNANFTLVNSLQILSRRTGQSWVRLHRLSVARAFLLGLTGVGLALGIALATGDRYVWNRWVALDLGVGLILSGFSLWFAYQWAQQARVYPTDVDPPGTISVAHRDVTQPPSLKSADDEAP